VHIATVTPLLNPHITVLFTHAADRFYVHHLQSLVFAIRVSACFWFISMCYLFFACVRERVCAFGSVGAAVN